MSGTFYWCAPCAQEQLFEVPPCEDGHGADCLDLACVDCGHAIVVGVLVADAELVLEGPGGLTGENGDALMLQLHPGEPEAGPWRAAPLTAVLEQLRRAAGATHGRPRIIAVDGRGGAGKTALVDALTALVPASAAVHTDDLAWHQAFFDWGDLLAAHVLEPLRRGEAVRYRPPAWLERGRPGAIEVPAGLDTVWVEGTGLVRRELRPLLDASVWLQSDLAEADRRLVHRDGGSDAEELFKRDWLREELPFMLTERPWEHVTLVIAGTAVLEHDPATELVVAPPLPPTG